MGYLAVDANAGSTKGEKNPDYGKLRMLEISADVSVPGPGQVQNTFSSNETIAQQVNLLRQGQSEVRNGNLLTLPVGGGLLYVQPIFVQASSGTQLPALRKILVAFGDEVAFEDTLQEALDKLFGGDSGATTGDEGTTPSPSPSGSPSPSATPGGGQNETPPAGVGDEIARLLQQARQVMMARDDAMQKGDWAAYGEQDKALTDIINRLIQLDGE